MATDIVRWECDAILNWVISQDFPQGAAVRLMLPDNLAENLATGYIDALKMGTHFHCALVKATIGWKDNFSGTLCCNKPLSPDYLVNDKSGQTYISIPGFFAFEELYVSKNHGRGIYHVYFDLN